MINTKTQELVTPEVIEAARNIYNKMYNGCSIFKYDGVVYDACRDWKSFVRAVALNIQKANRNNPNYHANKSKVKPKDTPSVRPKGTTDYAPIHKAYAKKAEKNTLWQNIALAGERGEINVEYELKWLGSDYVPVVRDCAHKDKKCIVLHDPTFIDEQQEIDHIVVSDKNVFIIETKNYKGTLEIQRNGNWVRSSETGKRCGSVSPVAQLDRHFKLVAHILRGLVSEKNIHRLICISNPGAVIVGEENSPIPIVKYDMLARKIQEINADRTAPLNVSNILKRLELYKVNQRLS